MNNNNMLAFPTPFTVSIQYDDGSWMRAKVFACEILVIVCNFSYILFCQKNGCGWIRRNVD